MGHPTLMSSSQEPVRYHKLAFLMSCLATICTSWSTKGHLYN